MFEKGHLIPFHFLVCLGALIALTSCSLLQKKPPQAVFRYAVKELPREGTSVIVWAIEQKSKYVGPDDKDAEQEAVRWLQEHGMVVVRRSRVEEVLEEQQLSLENDGTASLLSVGKVTGALQVILLQAYSDRVMIRGVATETGVMAWSGTGQYQQAVDEIDSKERKARARDSLTRRTLDAIWSKALDIQDHDRGAGSRPARSSSRMGRRIVAACSCPEALQ